MTARLCYNLTPSLDPGDSAMLTSNCRWFTTCRNPASGTINHPHLGKVQACLACATTLGLSVTTEREREEANSDSR